MLQAISMHATTTVVWPDDPAVDKEASDINGYIDTCSKRPGDWPKYLKMRPGENPTVFEIIPLPPSVLTQYEDETRGKAYTRNLLCFYRGVANIRNHPPAWLGSDKEIPKLDPGRGMPSHIPSYWLEQHFGKTLRQCAIFIGGCIWGWNQVGEEDVKNS